MNNLRPQKKRFLKVKKNILGNIPAGKPHAAIINSDPNVPLHITSALKSLLNFEDKGKCAPPALKNV